MNIEADTKGINESATPPITKEQSGDGCWGHLYRHTFAFMEMQRLQPGFSSH